MEFIGIFKRSVFKTTREHKAAKTEGTMLPDWIVEKQQAKAKAALAVLLREVSVLTTIIVPSLRVTESFL
jgi:hypothetical protein